MNPTTNKRCRRPTSSCGFSLVEVLVAILILGVALVGLTQGITLAVSSSKESELQTAAALFASGQIETLRAEGDFTDGETQGDCGEQLPLYRWRQTVTPAGISGLHEVAVAVENARTGQSIYELRTLLFQVPEDTTPRTGSTTRRRRER
jgi:general secretion pathway protein I